MSATKTICDWILRGAGRKSVPMAVYHAAGELENIKADLEKEFADLKSMQCGPTNCAMCASLQDDIEKRDKVISALVELTTWIKEKLK